MTTHPLAAIALHAVKLRRTVGEYAARRYAEQRGAGKLYRIARNLEAGKWGRHA